MMISPMMYVESEIKGKSLIDGDGGIIGYDYTRES